jgi:hypothetical protein
MKPNKTDGTKPLTLHVIPEEVQPRIAPVKKLKPGKEKTPKEKVVYKDQMERMTNRDWSGLKKRLRYVLKHLQKSYDTYQEKFLLFPSQAPPKSVQNRVLKRDRELIKAFEMVINFDGLIRGVHFTQADFRPSSWYRFYLGPDAIYEQGDLIPSKNLDKHPDAIEEYERAKKAMESYDYSQNQYTNLLKKDKQFPVWKR